MESLTREAMAKGVQESCFVILFLSAGVLERPFVRFELEEARKVGKKVLLVHEPDPRGIEALRGVGLPASLFFGSAREAKCVLMPCRDWRGDRSPRPRSGIGIKNQKRYKH